ncbi:MAG: ABC transporter substrate-binding protein [Deltaproteobacteria bacterium]|nr:ABC transporter substrate-binding protein [Deltaproteobacteria bacterium]
MRSRSWSWLFGAMALLLSVPGSAIAAGPAQKALEKPIRTLVSAVRYEKDALALKNLAGEEQGQALLGEHWEKASPEQRKQFVRDFQALFAALAFPKIRKAFEHLETIVYGEPTIEGKKATLESTLVVLHPVKKQEYRVKYDLLQQGKDWKVVDVQVLGTGRPSMLIGIRDEQVKPILEEGGVEAVLQVMTERLEQIAKAKKAG